MEVTFISYSRVMSLHLHISEEFTHSDQQAISITIYKRPKIINSHPNKQEAGWSSPALNEDTFLKILRLNAKFTETAMEGATHLFQHHMLLPWRKRCLDNKHAHTVHSGASREVKSIASSDSVMGRFSSMGICVQVG